MTLSSQKILPGILLAFLGFTLWTVCDALIKVVKDYPPYQLSWIAVAASVVLQMSFSRQLGGIQETLAKPHQKLQIIRGALYIVPGFLNFIVFAELPLSVAYAIIFMAPFITKILAMFILGEKIKPLSWGLTLMGFIGVLVVLRPGMIPIDWPVIFAFIGTFCFALGNVLTQKIGEENQTFLSYNIYTDVPFVFLLAIPAFVTFVPMPPVDLFITASIGILGFIGMIAVSRAFATTPTQYIAPIHYTQIVWGIIWGMVFFSEYPDGWIITGSIIIITAGLILVLRTKTALTTTRPD